MDHPSLTQISESVRACTKCALSKSRTHAVPGEGPGNASIMFVGEGPGYNEDQQGLPFVGQAGKLLDQLIATMGIYNWVNLHRDSFGATDAGGGAIGIEAVSSIPIPRNGAPNPVAHDTESQVPQQPTKPVERAQKEKESPNAVALKMKEKKRLVDVASERQRLSTRMRSCEMLTQNYAKRKPRWYRQRSWQRSGDWQPGLRTRLIRRSG